MAKASDVILVHGAWADGSSWSKVLPLLLARGLRATAVQLPLTSLKDDVATVKRALALEDGPTVLVGHSYGGVVNPHGHRGAARQGRLSKAHRGRCEERFCTGPATGRNGCPLRGAITHGRRRARGECIGSRMEEKAELVSRRDERSRHSTQP